MWVFIQKYYNYKYYQPVGDWFTLWHDVTSRDVMTCDVRWRHVLWRHVMTSCHDAMWRHVMTSYMTRHVTSCDVMSSCGVTCCMKSCEVTFCDVIWWRHASCDDVMWSHVMWRHMTSHDVMTCDVMWWCHDVVTSCHVTSWLVMSCDMLKDHIIPTRTVKEAFWALWRHHYDTGSRDVINDTAISIPRFAL